MFDESGCYKCGDKKKNGNEACDGADLGGKTCKALGWTGGALKCTSGCAHDPSGCYRLEDPQGILISPGSNIQGSPTVAFDGTNYFVFYFRRPSGTLLNVYGVRYDPQGKPVDKTPITVTSANNYQFDPAAAYGNGTYLVAYTDNRASASNYNIYVTRVTAAGKVLDPNGIPLVTKSGKQSDPRVAFDGTNWLVVWHDDRGSSQDIYGARVTAAGKVLEKDGFKIHDHSQKLWYPDVAFGDGVYLVVWGHGDFGSSAADIRGARISTAGKVVGPASIGISTSAAGQHYPTVASDGADFLVVWQDLRNVSVSQGDLRGTIVDKAGKVATPSGAIICDQKNTQGRSRAVWAEKGVYWVTWKDYRNSAYSSNTDIFATRVTAAGVALDGDGVAVTTAADRQEGAQLAHGKTNTMVVWEDKRASNYDAIYGARLVP